MLYNETKEARSTLPPQNKAWARYLKIAWGTLAIVNLALYLLAIPREFQTQLAVALRDYAPSLDTLHLTPQFYAAYLTIMDVALEIAFVLLGAVIFIRKPGDWMVFLIAISSMTFSSMFVPTLAHLAELDPVFRSPVALIRAVGLASSLIAFCFLFPDGRFVPRSTWILSIIWAILSVFWLINPSAPYNIVHLSTWVDHLAPSVAILFLAYGIGVVAQIWRYNHEPQAVKKQQIKWFLYGLLSALLGFAVYYLVLILFPILRAPGMPGLLYLLFGLPVLHISVLMVPLSLAIAISRFHLWDVDLLINRSLVYTALTTFILAFYGLAVIAFEQLFRWVWGWDRSPVAIAISTLLIAYLIGPLRNLIQQRVNKRFYRRRFDADLAITRLSLKLRDEVDIQKLAEALLNTVDETMQPEQVSLWLRKQD